MSTRDWDAHLNASPTGDFNLAANWSANTKPIAADIARILSGAISITTGFAAFAGVAMASWQVGDEYTGNIGNDSNWVDMEGVSGTYNGRGAEAWIRGAFSGKFVVEDTGSGALHLTNKVAGNLGACEFLDGTIYIADGTTMGAITVGDATVYIGEGVTHGGITMDGDGEVISSSNLGNCEGSGGVLRTVADDDLTLTGGTIKLRGMQLDHRSSGTLTAVENRKKNFLGLVTRNSPKGFAITTYTKARKAKDDRPEGDTHVTVGTLVKVFTEA